MSKKKLQAHGKPGKRTINTRSSLNLSLEETLRLAERQPNHPESWKALAFAFFRAGRYAESLPHFERLVATGHEDANVSIHLAKVKYQLGAHQEAEDLLKQVLEQRPNNVEILSSLAYIRNAARDHAGALPYLERAYRIDPNDPELLSIYGSTLQRMFRYEEALEKLRKGLSIAPDSFALLNNYGNTLSDIGRLDESIEAYSKAAAAPNATHVAFSNLITSIHYHPDYSAEAITAVCKQWNERYAPRTAIARPIPKDQTPDRTLRVGIVSDGFCFHPAGQMTIRAFEQIARSDMELYLYSASNSFDYITFRFQAIAKQWVPIKHLSEEALAERIRDDRIDILMDLAGHNSGNRMLSIAMQPAPLIVKWVGGLINTTGIDAIDYLISDDIETPPGVDASYVEKLIRLPGDYICYDPPQHMPEIEALPAKRNGFITLGCFNNAAKVNTVVLGEWAKIMQELPNSRLYLKSMQYNSAELCQTITQFMAEQGISAERLTIEGPSPHAELLKAYNQVDIALDPWPYSGGLTTCEAFLMGVPVVSLPGPTFAGRHSATHLVNAGMPELVVNSWDEYRTRVLELASDLDSLATIRTHLRDVLLQSPVCDAPRFAQQFSHAMRAIWQRYCEGKAPAALRIDTDNQAWFEDEQQPMQLQIPQTQGAAQEGDFQFNFEGKIITLDHGGLLLADKGFADLQALGAFANIAFDPASNIKNAERLQQSGELHYYPHVALGNGTEGTLYACLDPAMSGTLEPLPPEQQLPHHQKGSQALAKLPITTLRLDDIEGLESIDWLLLDNLNDSLSILENGEEALANTLLVQARVNFLATHRQQPELAQISHWLSCHGFSFYRLNNPQHCSHLPKRDGLLSLQETQLVYADALFVPSAKRMLELTENQKLKLAFILHTVYGIWDLSCALLETVTPELATSYLTQSGLIATRATITEKPGNPTPLTQRAEPLPPRKGKPAFAMATPKAFVGVPVYDEEQHIEEAIRSLAKQEMDGVSYLISDNCSTDRTIEIIRDTVGSDKRFKIIQQETNLGSFENFKFVFEQTDSEYFLWLGAHDYLSDEYLKETSRILDENPSVSMACGLPYAVLNAEVDGPTETAMYSFNEASPTERYINSAAKLANCTVFHSLFRRSNLKGFDFRKVISCDHVIISHLLWHGELKYARNSRYYRRYFEQRQENYQERFTGRKQELSRSDFYELYLDDFKSLAQKSIAEGELERHAETLKRILKSRFG